MGIFQEMLEVVNRTPWELTIKFDGQEMTLKLNYNFEDQDGQLVAIGPRKGVHNFVPVQALQYGFNQNVLMGSQDPDNPTISGAEYLIGLPDKANKYPVEPLTSEQIFAQKNRPSRFNHEELMEPGLVKGERIAVRGRKKVSQFEAKQGASITTEEFGVTSTD